MKRVRKIIIVVFFFSLLIMIRGFASKLFYDPLKNYFYNDYLYTSIPDVDEMKLILHMLLRYFLNSIVSLGIIWSIFQKKGYLKFSILFFGIAFFVLTTIFIFQLKGKFEYGYLLPFYIRRFIIHPLFLLLLLPAFYYEKLSSR